MEWPDKGKQWQRLKGEIGGQAVRQGGKRGEDEMIHLGALEEIRPALNQNCQATAGGSSSPFHPSFPWSHGILLRNLSTKKFCQAYFLVIAPLFLLLLPRSLSPCLPLRPLRSHRLNRAEGSGGGGHPALIIFNALTSVACKTPSIPRIYLSVDQFPSLTALRERATERERRGG